MPTETPDRWITLYDLPQFRMLARVGEAFGVGFSLRGGVASRLVMRRALNQPVDTPLVELAPFMSDVNLVHTGPADFDGALLEAILRFVPEAPWCMWRLLSAEEGGFRPSPRARVPLREVSIDSWRSAPPDAEVLDDIAARRVSITGAPERYAATRYIPWPDDDEPGVLAVLRALNAAVDLAVLTGDRVDIDDRAAERLLAEAADRASFGNSRDRAMALGLQASLAARAPRIIGDTTVLDQILAASDVLCRLPESGQALVMTPAFSPGGAGGFGAVRLRLRLGEQAYDPFEGFLREGDLRLDPAFDVRGATDVITLDGPRTPPEDQAMLSLAWRGPASAGDIRSAIGFDEANRPLAPWAVGGSFGQVQWLRMDLSDHRHIATLRVAMVDAQGRKRTEPEPAIQPVIGGPTTSVTVEETDAANWLTQDLENRLGFSGSNGLTTRTASAPRRLMTGEGED